MKALLKMLEQFKTIPEKKIIPTYISLTYVHRLLKNFNKTMKNQQDQISVLTSFIDNQKKNSSNLLDYDSFEAKF